MENEIITINAILKNLSSTNQDIKAQVFCKDNYAVAHFSDKKFAKKLFKHQKEMGHDVKYEEKLNIVVEKYKNKSAKEISEIISNEMKRSGGTLQQ